MHIRMMVPALLAGALAMSAGCSKGSIDAKRVEELEKQLKDNNERIAKLETFLKPFMNQPPPPPEPDPAAVYAVSIDGNPFKGSADAPVTIVEAFEFAWPYCQKVGPTLEQLMNDYPGKVRVVYKHYVVHPDNATVPALASCAAAMQDKFGEMEHLIWTKGFAERDLSPDKMLALATEAKLDLDKFKADMQGEACSARVQADQQELARFGINGTPGFFINGRFLGGAQPIGAFKKIVDEELKKAEAKIAAGIPAAEYYQTAVVQNGLKSLEAPK